jgi:hypothetical protein
VIEVQDKEALIDAAAILHQIALAGHEDGGRDSSAAAN